MFEVLGENYYVDFDEIENYIDMSDSDSDISLSGETNDVRINLIKYELVKMMLEVVVSEDFEHEDTLGLKPSKKYNNLTVPFRIAFNSLLNKKLINHY